MARQKILLFAGLAVALSMPGLVRPAALGLGESKAEATHGKGAAIIEQMHAKYRGSWYKTTQFAQKTTTYDADGKPKVEMWYERIQLPGEARVDIGAPKDGNAIILKDGHAYNFTHGNLVNNQPMVSIALLLAFGVYQQSPDITIAQLVHEGFDTTKVHEESWEGQPVYVIGADRGDLNAKQVWIDKKRLLLVRMISATRMDPALLSDVRFLDYREEPRGAAIAARIDVYTKQRLVMSEEYSDIQTDVPLDAAWFDVSKLRPQVTGK